MPKKRVRANLAVLLLCICLCIARPCAIAKGDSAKIKPILLERTPSHLSSYHPERTRYAYSEDKVWAAGSTLIVAFCGGDESDRRHVEEVANEWTKHGNIKFDFKHDNSEEYLEWGPKDDKPRAHIRVAFGQGGFWSAVGRDSMDQEMFPPNKPSLNLDIANCPEEDVDCSILHEFGHALGFHHEHQRPDGVCNKEFRWQDDDGYRRTRDSMGMFVEDGEGRRPGVYTWSSGPPNNISADWIDKNMRTIKRSSAFVLGPKDRNSIMHYHFPEFFFRSGKKSECFCPTRQKLTKLDIQGMRKAYPQKSKVSNN